MIYTNIEYMIYSLYIYNVMLIIMIFDNIYIYTVYINRYYITLYIYIFIMEISLKQPIAASDFVS